MSLWDKTGRPLPLHSTACQPYRSQRKNSARSILEEMICREGMRYSTGSRCPVHTFRWDKRRRPWIQGLCQRARDRSCICNTILADRLTAPFFSAQCHSRSLHSTILSVLCSSKPPCPPSLVYTLPDHLDGLVRRDARPRTLPYHAGCTFHHRRLRSWSLL